jgi:peptidoglycan/LPS O-acetylase OafA/YrhL
MVATSFGAMGSAAENSVQLGEELHSSIVASIYFSASIGSGAALALIGPLPLMSGGQRIATGITAVALTGLEADLAIYAASVLLIVLAQQPGRFRDVLRSVPLVWLGRMSFSLYLIHAPIMVAWLCLTHAALPLWAIAASGGLIALALSPPFHRLVEQPSRDLARFAEKRLRRPADGEVKAYSGR